jgi:hypothetical protein
MAGAAVCGDAAGFVARGFTLLGAGVCGATASGLQATATIIMMQIEFFILRSPR